MPNDPQYVRLTNRLSRQIVADVTEGSGWSIAGLDVKPFPEDDAQAAFVRQKLGQGILEPASKAEFEEIQNEDDVLEVVDRYRDPHQPHPWQEAEVQAVHAKRRAALEAKRSDDSEEEPEEWEGQQRYAETLAEQDELGLNTDDPEEQLHRTARGGVRAKKAAASKKSAPKDTSGD